MLWPSPTAHTSCDDEAAIPRRAVPWSGVETTLHVMPSQCSRSVRFTWGSDTDVPATHASIAEIALTPKSWAAWSGLGLGTTLHDVPSKCSIRVCEPVRV